MTPFDPDAQGQEDVALALLRNTSVTMFWRPEVLAEKTSWLRSHGYRLIELNASSWSSEQDLHRDIAAALEFPDYYGRNLNALKDCIGDFVLQHDSSSPREAGLVLVFTGYQAFAENCPGPAQAVLDILACHSREAALAGRRVLYLVQSDDPDISFEPVGATPVMWNDAEWFDARRHPNR